MDEPCNGPHTLEHHVVLTVEWSPGFGFSLTPDRSLGHKRARKRREQWTWCAHGFRGGGSHQSRELQTQAVARWGWGKEGRRESWPRTRESTRHTWGVKRPGWAKGKKMNDWRRGGAQKKSAKREKARGLMGLWLINPEWWALTLGRADRWRPSLCLSSPPTPDSPSQIITRWADPPPNRADIACMQTTDPVGIWSANSLTVWETDTLGQAESWSWRLEWADWFSRRIDWAELVLGSTAREGAVSELQPVCLLSVLGEP